MKTEYHPLRCYCVTVDDGEDVDSYFMIYSQLVPSKENFNGHSYRVVAEVPYNVLKMRTRKSAKMSLIHQSKQPEKLIEDCQKIICDDASLFTHAPDLYEFVKKIAQDVNNKRSDEAKSLIQKIAGDSEILLDGGAI